jgi:hypothetical protein
LFPQVVDGLLPMLIDDGRADLFEIGEILNVVLAARRAGVDCDTADVSALRWLVQFVLMWSQATAVVDIVGDQDAVRAGARAALEEFDRRFFAGSYDRRLPLAEAGDNQEDGSTGDMMSLLLRSRAELGMDRSLILRETATYLQAATHTSGQTLVHVFDVFFDWAAGNEQAWDRLRSDRFFAQRCVQETLRLRPTTPRIKRLAEADTRVGDVAVPRGGVVVLDVAHANTDPQVWGDRADHFDPERTIPAGHQPWGLSFGAGPHICIGRTVAAGLPSVSRQPESHLTGLITYMVQAVARLGVEPDPQSPPVRDSRTERGSRWASYPVRFRHWQPRLQAAQG